MPRPRKSMSLLTNDLDSSASLIAELYRNRWGIELFFKWLKQHLKIKQMHERRSF